MFAPFSLKKSIGESYSMDLEDSLNTKKALASLGHLKVPDGGLDEYPDGPMIEAVKSFQRANNLVEDGVMKPDGPTLKRLNESLVAEPKPSPWPQGSIIPDPRKNAAPPFTPIALKRPVRASSSADLGDTGLVKTALERLGLRLPEGAHDPYPTQGMFQNIRAFQQREGLRVDGEMLPGGETEKRMNEKLNAAAASATTVPGATRQPAKSPATQFAGEVGRDPMAPAAAGIAAGIASKLFQDQLGKKVPTPDASPRTNIAPPMPPQPGFEPPKEKLPDRTESIPQPVELPDLSGPLPKTEKPTIFVLPAPEPGEFGDGIVERKGNEATRKELERIRDHFRGKGWKHVAGGRYAPDDPDVLDPNKPEIYAGKEREERHIKGHFGSLKGGHFTDLTFKDERGRTIHVQSVDVDRNGKPTQRELDNAERIRRAGKDVDVYLIPKGAQLERNQRYRK